MADWKKISDFPSYEVSNEGEVRNCKTGLILKPQNTNGYSHVTLSDSYGHHQKLVHRIVAKEFVDNSNDYPIVNHIDGIKTNNRAENLEWCTYSMNMKHAYSTGLQRPIESQIKDSLNKARESRKRPVRNIITGERYESIIDCAKKENICHSAVSFHLAGKAKRPRFEYADEGGIYNGQQA